MMDDRRWMYVLWGSFVAFTTLLVTLVVVQP